MAYVGGVHLEEMNLLEGEFMKFLDWRLWVDPTEYDFYLKGLMQHFTQQEQMLQMQMQANENMSREKQESCDLI